MQHQNSCSRENVSHLRTTNSNVLCNGVNHDLTNESDLHSNTNASNNTSSPQQTLESSRGMFLFLFNLIYFIKFEEECKLKM